MRYEIFAEAGGWKWRVMDGFDAVTPASPLLSHDRCRREVQILKMTMEAPVVIVDAG
ncbi:MAG TPA: hypothetical protein VEO95_08185 [Chthoniobacteraceae bacterium]|nr:hypothetical protein [Chthoniobacteraceae bacterium]